MSETKTAEEKIIHHILLSLGAFLLMVVLERIVGRLPVPMWAHGVLGLVNTIVAYGVYRWAARKWVGPALPFVWVLTVIGASVAMMLRGGVRVQLFNALTMTLSVYWKDLVVAYLFEWFATPKGHTYARRQEFLQLGTTGSILFMLLALNVIVYDSLIAHVGNNTILIGVVLYMVFGGWALLNAHSGIQDQKFDKVIASYTTGSTKVTKYLKLTGVEAVEHGIDAYGWVLAFGMLFFYLWRFFFM